MDWTSKIKGRKNTKSIGEKTNTLFRQLDSLDVSFTLTNNKWKKGAKSKDALVFFSRKTKYLVIIPKQLVDEFIFYPIFEAVDGKYQFKTKYLKYKYESNSNRINILFNDYDGMISLRLRPEEDEKTVDLFKMPKGQYWRKIDLSSSENPLKDLVDKINSMTKKLSDADGIIRIRKLDS